MSLLSTLALGIGPAVGKAVARMILRDDTAPAELASELVELLKGSAAAERAGSAQGRRVAAVAVQVATKLRPLFDEARLPANERAAVTQALERTLADAQIDARLLLDCALDPQRLAERLAARYPEATTGLSEAATGLYRNALDAAAIELVALVTELGSFERLAWAHDLQSQEEILDYLAELHARPAAEATTFLGDYRATLCNTYDRLELFGIPTINDAIRRQQLSMAYVTLEAEPTKAKHSGTQRISESMLLMQLLEQRDLPGRTEIGPVERVIAPRRRVVLRGEAGAGKTTLLRWLAVRAVTRSFPALLAGWNDCVPFLIPLRKWASEGFPALDQFLGDLERTLGEPPTGWVREQLRSGWALLLIDGVDELPQASRAAMLEGLSRLVAQYPLPRYIITSRPLAVSEREWPEWVEWAEAAGFSALALREMDQATTERLIDRWHAALAPGLTHPEERAELPELSGNLKRLLRVRPELRRLSSNPLLCAMLCALHRETGQSLPAQRVELYQQCIEMLLHRRDDARKVPAGDDFPKLSNAQKLWLLREFALSLRLAGKLTADVQHTDAFFNDKLQATGQHNEGRGKALRLFLIERANLLHEPVEGQIEFRHRTFHDYLAALALVNQRAIGTLLDRAGDEQWHDLIALAAGMTEQQDTDRLLCGLLSKDTRLKVTGLLKLNRDRTQRYRLNVLALSCLEVARAVSLDARDAVLRQAATLFPPQTVEEADIVVVGGEAVVPLLAANPKHNEEQAALCVYVLGRIGGTAALEQLAGYGGDERDKVVGVLCSVWAAFDRHTYARRVLARQKRLVLDGTDTLEGIEELSYLTELWLIDSTISDLTPLVDLTSLTQLYLFRTQVQDVTPLVRLINLTQLVLNKTQVQDVTSLAGLTSLTTLDLSDTWVQDLTPLAGITRLTELDLSRTQVQDLTPLVGLTSLTKLDLSDTQVQDLTPLVGITSLAVLYLSGTQVQNLIPLAALTSLTKLVLSDTQVQDLTPLAGLTNLTELYLSGTQGQDWSPLTGLTSLTKLHLSGTQVQDLTPLAGLTRLTELYLNNTQVQDLTPLAGLTRLTKLNLINTQVQDLTSLSNTTGTVLVLILETQQFGSAMLRRLPKIKLVTNRGEFFGFPRRA